MISLQCPKCGANLEANDSLEKAYCNYCGNMCIISEALTQKQVIDESHKLKPFLDLSESSLRSGDYERCIEFADKAIEIDGRNAQAWYLKGCASEGIRRDSGRPYFEMADRYCTDPELKSRIAKAANNPEDYVKVRGKKLRIDASGADKRFFKDKFSVYIDKEKVAVVEGGETASVQISLGKHEISMRTNSHTFKDFKRKVLVDDRDLRLRIVKNKDKTISWELDEY